MKLTDVSLQSTSDTGGGMTVNAEKAITGLLYAVEWIDGTFDDGVDAVVTIQNTGSGVAQTVLTLTDANVDKWYFPRTPQHDDTGGDNQYVANFEVLTQFVVNGTLRLVVTNGGNAKTGGCIVWVQED